MNALSNSDTEFVARETEIPGLKLLMDPGRVAQIWCKDHQGIDPASASIKYIRYKPGRRCIVVYHLVTCRGDVQIVATAYDRQGWNKHLRTFDDSTCDTNPLAADQFAKLWISVAQFPRDRKLRALESLRRSETAKNTLERLLKEEADDRVFRMQCVGYKPGKRAVFDVQMSGGRRFAVKLFDSQSFEPSRYLTQAWSNVGKELHDLGVAMPELIRVNSKQRILVTRWLAGNTLACEMASQQSCPKSMRDAGRALRIMHDTKVKHLLGNRGRGETKTLRHLAADIGLLVPSLKRTADSLAKELETRLVKTPSIELPIHGDFYAKQVCIDEGVTGIIDFDQSQIGDPIRDVGNFIAKLVFSSYRGDFPTDRLTEFEQQFIDGYCGKSQNRDLATLDLNVAAGLFKCVTHPFRCGMANWHDHLANIMELAADRISRLPKLRSLRSQNHASCFPDSNCRLDLLRDVPEAWMANALIPERARQNILQHIPSLAQYGRRLDVDDIVILRCKPKRRCLIRYDLRIDQSQSPNQKLSILGKLRFKGVDRHGYLVQQQLFERGLNQWNPHGVSVPETLGIAADSRMWFQKIVPGKSLEQLITHDDEGLFESAVDRIAHSLLMLHRTPVSIPAKNYTVADEVESLASRLRFVAREQPRHSDVIEELIARAIGLECQLALEPCGPIHRDFHPAQVLVTSDRLNLLDFDLYCHGPIMLDAGNFLAHLWELGIRNPHQAARWEQAADRFGSVYCRISCSSQQNLERWAWLAFARHIWISTQIPDRSGVTEELIGAVVRRAADCLPAA
ncbi:MAG: aminoglycoside phosphotransferase family protein [Planctomycetales bacterium]|nr:aminoglycoside phosphotransferase family protein [Planctomycetales bacterium]